MINPKVSIIIPVYNREDLIIPTLDCVKHQTYNNWECIIVDDGSQDNTLLVVKKYTEGDNRFKVLKRPKCRNKGASTSRNIGIENATGNWIQFLDSDDIMQHNKIEEQVKLIKNKDDQSSIITCKWGRFIKKIDDSANFDDFASYNNFDDVFIFLKSLETSQGYFPIHAYLFPKNIIERAGLWNEFISLSDDTEFVIRVLCNICKIKYADNTRVYYRWTKQENVSSYNSKQKVKDLINIVKKMDLNLKLRFKTDHVEFIDFLKQGIYINTKKSFPELIKENNFFFKKQLNEKRLLTRIISKFTK